MATALDAADHHQTATSLDSAGTVLICDLGGGTFDLAVVSPAANGVVTMKSAASGDSQLGMANIDTFLALMIYSEFKPPVTRRIQSVIANAIVRGPELMHAWDEVMLDPADKAQLLDTTEGLKKSICNVWRKNQQLFPVVCFDQSLVIRRSDIEPMLQSFASCVRRAVESELARLIAAGKLSTSGVSRVVLGGGGSNLPGIDALLQDVVGAPVVRSSNGKASSMVQRGAALFARNPQLIRERRCGHSYGVKTFRLVKKGETPTHETQTVERNGTEQVYQAVFKRFFEKDEPIPVMPREYTFTPLFDNQSGVGFDVLEGESEDPTANRAIDSVELSLPPGIAHNYEVTCEFRLEADGLIHVVAKDVLNPLNRSDEITFEVAPEDSE